MPTCSHKFASDNIAPQRSHVVVFNADTQTHTQTHTKTHTHPHTLKQLITRTNAPTNLVFKTAKPTPNYYRLSRPSLAH